MRHLSADEIASVLIARLMREVQHFVANSLIRDGASADEVWGGFLENLNNGKTSAPDVAQQNIPDSSSVPRIVISFL
jgi:hypothetical protein